MRHARICSLVLMGATSLGMVFAPVTAAQDYPLRPITLVVPFAPGGGSTSMARLIGREAGAAARQDLVIENKPGAGAIIASTYVAEVRSDGYTL